MSKEFFKLSSGNFFQDWSATGLLSTADNWDQVASVMGYRGDNLATTGRDARTVLTDGTPVIDVNTNATNPNTNTTGGVTEFHLADPVVALQGSGTADAPHLVVYLDASGRKNLHFSVDLRDIDASADNAVQQICVQYRIGDSGDWTALPDGYVADASTGGQANLVTHLDVSLPAALNNQSQVEIRILTVDATGSDEWIGIDNISVTSEAAGADNVAPTLVSSTPEDDSFAVAPGGNLTLSFDELVKAGTGHITIDDGNGDLRVIDINDASQVTVSGQNVVINPTANLKLGTAYQVSVDAGAIADLAGNAYAGTGADPIDFRTIDAMTRIFDIQGAGHTSAYDGKLVNTRGVVTAVDTTGTKGFWIQDPEGDGNAATSDALFVYSTRTVQVGDLVELQGVVDEYQGSDINNLTVTELTDVQELTVLSSGHTIAPTILGHGGRMVPTEVVDSDHFQVFNPDTDAIDFYESLEGMLVTAKDVQTLTTTYENATFAMTDSGAYASGTNDRGGITSSEGDRNPERFEIYSDTGVNPDALPVYVPGDKLGDVTGMMHYYAGLWELVPTVTPNAPVRTAISRDVTTLEGGDAQLMVGAYNLENISPTDGQAKFDAIARDIAVNLSAPDILGVEEIQDNNGTGKGVLAADVTLNMLVDAIVAAGGPRYQWVSIDPVAENANGGESNGNIRNAILYNADRVSFVDGSLRQITDTTPADGDGFRNSRKPLVGDFLFHGEEVTFVSVHNYSRLGSDELFGQNQPPVNSGDARRIDQSTAIRDFVRDTMAQDPDANIVIGGDFNAFHYETSLRMLEADGQMTNMVWSLDPLDRYSSGYQGSNEQIDHLLVSSNLAGNTQFDNVHMNSNQPYGTAPTDHDAVLARTLINTAPVAAAELVAGTEDVALVVDAAHGVLANDTDRNGDALTAELVAGPGKGQFVLNADGSFSFIAPANFHGVEHFSYVARDAYGGVSAVMTVELNIASVNDLPVAGADSAAVQEDSAVIIDVLGNDSDVDGDAMSIVLGGAASAAGAAISIENGKVRYVASADSFDQLTAGQSVADTFTYRVVDANGGLSAPVTVTVTVSEAGDNVASAGTNKADNFSDAAGFDTSYSAGNGDDRVFGNDGADVLDGGNGADSLSGGDGADQLKGGNGDDVLSGGAGADMLEGGNGADILFGGLGNDVLSGGLGGDKFVVAAGSHTVITDFGNGDRVLTGYTGDGSLASLTAFAGVAGSPFNFADTDSDGNGTLDAVAVTGQALGDGSITLLGWSAAALQQQGLWM
ncbi:Ig-like domain-containing protein [Massilia endophytica]|uniref:Ig-like domain-containing protein n=1 Tax=Massilia endophytica TaxID=2899220 RepID=UPI001E421985|nr:Ig-like domain-containing protein [Massilia endophytica]UGQ47308.1 Ig-like domain-containing protein [Massilia endophytica]